MLYIKRKCLVLQLKYWILTVLFTLSWGIKKKKEENLHIVEIVVCNFFMKLEKLWEMQQDPDLLFDLIYIRLQNCWLVLMNQPLFVLNCRFVNSIESIFFFWNLFCCICVYKVSKMGFK